MTHDHEGPHGKVRGNEVVREAQHTPGKRSLADEHDGAHADASAVTAAGSVLADAARHGGATLERAIQRILDAAHRADRATAAQLVHLVAPYAAGHPQLADAVRSLQASAHPTPKLKLPSSPATAVKTTGTAAFDWTELIGHPVSDDDRDKLRAIAAGRPAKLAAEHARLGAVKMSWIDERKPNKKTGKLEGYEGWQYQGKADPAEGAFKKPADRLLKLAMEETTSGASIEAHAGGIVTYDGTLSIGAGFANNNAIEYLGRWLAKDSGARARLLEAGIAVLGGTQLVVIDDAGMVRSGGAAQAFLRDRANGGLLAYIAELIEQPGSIENAVQAEIEQTKHLTVDKLSPAMQAAMRGWSSDDAIRAAFHLGLWAWAGPQARPDLYMKTGGDGLALVHAFAVAMAHYTRKVVPGPYILGGDLYTQFPLAGHMERWGNGHLTKALGGFPPVTMTFDQARHDAGRDRHVLIAIGKVGHNDPNPVAFHDTGVARV